MAFVFYVSCYIQLSHLLILTVALLNGIDETLCICFDPLMVLMKI